uniref:Cytochrome P450 n=1 Tax=Megaselia scalaris TaxID=36166 RepID=T1H1J0_MEGSC
MGLIMPILLIISIFILVITYLSWNYNYWKKRGVNGPRPVLVFGNFPKTGRGEAHMIYEIDKYYQSSEKFIGLFWARTPQLLLLDPKLIKDILITNFKAFHDNDSSHWPIKNVDRMAVSNPFMVAGDAWKDKRIEVVSGITSAKLKTSYPIMKNAATKLSNYLKENLNKTSELEAKNFSQKFTGEIIGDFLWGIEAGAFTSPDDDCPIVLSAQDTDKFFLNIQKEAMAMRLNSKHKRGDMLDHLLQIQEKKHISTVDITGHSLTVVLDGFESSGLILSQTLLFLSRNIGAQQKLRQEIMAHLDDSGFLSFEDLNDLPYLDQCVNESLRILPAVPILGKICTEPFEFENSNRKRVKINKGLISLIPIYSLHHDPDVYPDSESFIPERFDEENGGVKKYKESGHFMPFGDGPRICLGMKLTLVEIKTGVVEIIKNFELTCSDKTKPGNEANDDTAYLLSFKGDIVLNMKVI